MPSYYFLRALNFGFPEIFFFVIYPWYSRKYLLHRNIGMTSLTPTTSDSIDLLVFIFCLMGFEYIETFSGDKLDPGPHFIYDYISNDVSTYHFILCVLSTSWVKGVSGSPLSYLMIRPSFL